MKKLFIITLLFLSGCASITNYKPIVDTYDDPRASFLVQDTQECEQIAKQVSVEKDVLSYGATGALVGGAGGAAYGALFGNPAIGAAAGAIGSSIASATYGGFQADERYKRVYRNCLRGRGHKVLD
jgi:outer membrane lipoprotein SlyB